MADIDRIERLIAKLTKPHLQVHRSGKLVEKSSPAIQHEAAAAIRLLLDELSRRSEVIERAREAMREASQALEYSINTLDGVVALDDEDMGKDGGSSACQATIKINRRAMAKLAGLLK